MPIALHMVPFDGICVATTSAQKACFVKGHLTIPHDMYTNSNWKWIK